ncbi:hypothetical protein [Methylophaga lonarensis]|uniref:DUF7940 domain-containing protein n=1 Tax=Methylophaga lonarensis TaxID=999151 RepID=UPI003D2B13CC
MKLVKNWKQCPRWWSVRLGFAALMFEAGQIVLPEWIGILPEPYADTITAILITGAIFARVIKQEIDTNVQN